MYRNVSEMISYNIYKKGLWHKMNNSTFQYISKCIKIIITKGWKNWKCNCKAKRNIEGERKGVNKEFWNRDEGKRYVQCGRGGSSRGFERERSQLLGEIIWVNDQKETENCRSCKLLPHESSEMRERKEGFIITNYLRDEYSIIIYIITGII